MKAVIKTAAAELASRKVRINTVSPEPVATKIVVKIRLYKNLEGQMRSCIPLARFGKPDEVANLITYLSSDNALFITGSGFLIDGGQLI